MLPASKIMFLIPHNLTLSAVFYSHLSLKRKTEQNTFLLPGRTDRKTFMHLKGDLVVQSVIKIESYIS